MDPQFTIVTPSFQSIKWLPLCVASVADQSGVTCEHLIQDAGSTDGTPEWILRDGRATLCAEPDQGMYDAVNRGLRRARGQLLAYLNCDEQYLSGTLQKVRTFFEHHPEIDVLFGDAVLVDAEGHPISYRRMVTPWRSHVRWVHLNTLTCSTFFRRSIVERGFLFDPRWKAIGDAVWINNLLAAGLHCATLPEPLAAFTFTGENLGASERAYRELREWQAGGWQVRFAPLFSFVHWLRKWKAGAYRKRVLDLELFTPATPNVRTPLQATVGYRWPESA